MLYLDKFTLDKCESINLKVLWTNDWEDLPDIVDTQNIIYCIENQNIVDVISIPEKKNYRERYKRISQSATFKRIYHNKSIGDVISVENYSSLPRMN